MYKLYTEHDINCYRDLYTIYSKVRKKCAIIYFDLAKAYFDSFYHALLFQHCKKKKDNKWRKYNLLYSHP